MPRRLHYRPRLGQQERGNVPAAVLWKNPNETNGRFPEGQDW